MLTANSTSNSAARLSQYNESLQDAGPVPKQSSHSRPSRQSSLLSMKSTDSGEPSPAFITAFGDLRPNRDSMVSLQEAEYGWAGSASAVTAATKANRKVQPAPKPAQRPYRPPFAPSVSDTDLEAVVPVVASDVPSTAGAKLGRGKSLKEKIQGAIRRDKSPDPFSTSPRRESPLEATREEEDWDDDKKGAQSAEFIVGGTSPDKASPRNEGFAEGIVRRLSRRTTRRAKPAEPEYPLPSQAEIDEIPLFAAPPEANVRNAPMLSSYAPRPALRPRSMTEGATGGANLKATPSITVGAARLAYAKSISRQQRTGHPAVPSVEKTYAKDDLSTLPKGRSRNSSASSSITEEHLSIPARNAKPRRSRQVPEGWQPANAFVEKPTLAEADEEKATSSKRMI